MIHAAEDTPKPRIVRVEAENRSDNGRRRYREASCLLAFRLSKFIMTDLPFYRMIPRACCFSACACRA